MSQDTSVPSGFAAFITVERHHEENKRAHADMDERIKELEIERARISERIVHLDGTMEQLTKAINDLRPTKPWHIFVATLPLILAGLGVVWQASKYPTRDDMDRLVSRMSVMEVEIKVNRQLQDLRLGPASTSRPTSP